MTLRKPPDRPHGAGHGSPPATPAGGADEIIEATRPYGVRPPGSALALVKGLLLVESIALELAPDFRFFTALKGMASEIRLHAAEEAVTRELPRLVEECVEALRRLPDLLPPGPAPGRPTLMEAR